MKWKYIYGCDTRLAEGKVPRVLVRPMAGTDEAVKTRPVIVRFCGTSPGSNTGLGLVRSICRQVHFAVAGANTRYWL